MRKLVVLLAPAGPTLIDRATIYFIPLQTPLRATRAPFNLALNR